MFWVATLSKSNIQVVNSPLFGVKKGKIAMQQTKTKDMEIAEKSR